MVVPAPMHEPRVAVVDKEAHLAKILIYVGRTESHEQQFFVK